MNVLDCVKNGLFYLDGGNGSVLQARGLLPGELPELWNITHAEEIVSLHKAYYDAGSHAVCSNTFGANGLKFDGKNGNPTVVEVVGAAITCAKIAREQATGGQNDKFIALDIGPLGRMLAPMGDLQFEDAVSLFAEVVRAGVEAGADLILIETMNDSYETKAAVIAAKENCNLPIFVSNVYDEQARLMSGANPEAMVALLEGLGVDVIGLNCSLGPDQMGDIVETIVNCCSVPILVKPNAGLPHEHDGKTCYSVTPEHFASVMATIVEKGGRVIGGCCGTNSDYIRALVGATKELTPLPITKKRNTVISSSTHAVYFGNHPILIGERINPTGKKRFKQALLEQDIGFVLKEALTQQECGVHVLDVNVGLAEIDEATMLETCVREIQAVCTLPLQIDTSNKLAMERALRIYNGKPMINSVNASPESMAAIFPLAKKYGGVIVCLTLDEANIPKTAEGRLEMAKRIVDCAEEYGILRENLIFDPLALTISSDSSAAMVTLDAISLITNELSANTSLGISNISFGLPNREIITSTFFAMAFTRGLSAAIINPLSLELHKAYHSFLALSGKDANCQQYIRFATDLSPEQGVVAKPKVVASHSADTLKDAIIRGLSDLAGTLSAKALETSDALTLINEEIVPALDVVGRGFEQKTVFLPQLLMSAEAAKAAFEQAKAKLPPQEQVGPAIIVATVKGDIHDIGKNIVKALLENYSFRVVDLGRDVAPEVIVEKAISLNISLVGLSALMTTTVPAMAKTITLLREQKPDTRIMVGGAVLTQDYADRIGADFYGKTAMDSVRFAEQLFAK